MDYKWKKDCRAEAQEQWTLIKSIKKNVGLEINSIPDEVASDQTQLPAKRHTITAHASYTIHNDLMPDFGISVYNENITWPWQSLCEKS